MDQEDEFIVEKILRARIKQGMPELLIKWEGFPSPSDNTWEPMLNLINCEEKIIEFNTTLKRKLREKRLERYRLMRQRKIEEKNNQRVVSVQRRWDSLNVSTCSYVTKRGRKPVVDEEEMSPTEQESIKPRQNKEIRLKDKKKEVVVNQTKDVEEFIKCKFCQKPIKNTHNSKRRHCAKKCEILHPKKVWLMKSLEDK